jgi:hypothetical protein
MFIAYALFYGGFVALNLYKPVTRVKSFWQVLTWQIVYGSDTVALSLVYDAMCRRKEAALKESDTEAVFASDHRVLAFVVRDWSIHLFG